MKLFNKSYYLGFVLAMLIIVSSCQQPGPNNPGSEYMPDMAHSVAYEANYYTYYSHNNFGTENEYYEMAKPRKPVTGTIPRDLKNNQRSAAQAGTMPYGYVDTEESREKAIAELISNPYPITTDGLARGKDLYNTFCAICHGEKGDGAGYLVRDANPATGDEGGKYPVQPAILINDEFTASSNGRLYHAIMYGKNLMGGYPDKMNSEERWQVVHYIRALQAQEKKQEYTQLVNTLNSVDLPAGSDYKVMPSSYNPNAISDVTEMLHDSHDAGDHHGSHEGDHGNHDHEHEATGEGEHHSGESHGDNSHDDDHSHNQESHKH